MSVDLGTVQPFEICSIRPPTENDSLTFRLTRNCYWNQCAFCPSYKLGARFSKRTLEEVKEDIRKAKRIDDLLYEHGIGLHPFNEAEYGRVTDLVDRVRQARGEHASHEEGLQPEIPQNLDPRLVWFLSWFKDKPTLEDSIMHVLSWRSGGGETCFLGDADGLILKPDFMQEAIHQVKLLFPSVDRFTIYGRTKTAARVRKEEDLACFCKAGLHRVHFGVESGSDQVLQFMKKGVTRTEHVEGGRKAKEAGLSVCIYVMPGLGGAAWSEMHARETADVITRISPDFVRLRSLQIFPQTPLEEAAKAGDFTEASEEQVVQEIRIMVEEVRAETEMVSDSAANLLDINGKIPEDREAMLRKIDAYLAMPKRGKLVFSLYARLHAFAAQYGGLTRDISDALSPYITFGRPNFSSAPDTEIEGITRMIRSKLMP